MRIDQLVGLSAEDWNKISDEELYKFLEPYLKITRPETGRIEGKPHVKKVKLVDSEGMTSEQQQAKAYLEMLRNNMKK